MHAGKQQPAGQLQCLGSVTGVKASIKHGGRGEASRGGEEQRGTTAINLVKGAAAVKALSSFCRSCLLTTLRGRVSPGINTIPAAKHTISISKVLPALAGRTAP